MHRSKRDLGTQVEQLEASRDPDLTVTTDVVTVTEETPDLDGNVPGDTHVLETHDVVTAYVQPTTKS